MTPKTRNILLLSLLTLGLAGAAYWLWRTLFRDGIGITGHYDDEGGIASVNPNNDDMAYPTYHSLPMQMAHFKISEFDSPDVPGTGVRMKVDFLKKLDQARSLAGIPFHVNSGYRTQAHNKSVGGVNDSSHTRGWASDIAAPTQEQKVAIVRAARQAGFNRFGIYDTFVHLDCDPSKKPNVAWNKKMQAVKQGGNFSEFPFDPFTV